MTLKELQYRSFDDLMASVRGDLRTYDLEGFIEDQDLIKVAARINREMGLRINPAREKTLDIRNGSVRLPPDFRVLNFAMLCGSAEVSYAESMMPGYMESAEQTLGELQRLASLMNARPYTGTQTMPPGESELTHNLGSTDLVIRLYDVAGKNIDFTYRVVNRDKVIVDLRTQFPEPVHVHIIGATSGSCTQLQTNPVCDTVCTARGGRATTYKDLQRIDMLPSDTPGFVAELHARKGKLCGHIKDGYLHIGGVGTGTVYLNYQSNMETPDGDLIVLDDEIGNEYYEYACKERIMENMMIAGEPVDKAWQLISGKLGKARFAALSLSRRQDFAELKRMKELNRKAQFQKYFSPFA